MILIDFLPNLVGIYHNFMEFLDLDMDFGVAIAYKVAADAQCGNTVGWRAQLIAWGEGVTEVDELMRIRDYWLIE